MTQHVFIRFILRGSRLVNLGRQTILPHQVGSRVCAATAATNARCRRSRNSPHQTPHDEPGTATLASRISRCILHCGGVDSDFKPTCVKSIYHALPPVCLSASTKEPKTKGWQFFDGDVPNTFATPKATLGRKQTQGQRQGQHNGLIQVGWAWSPARKKAADCCAGSAGRRGHPGERRPQKSAASRREVGLRELRGGRGGASAPPSTGLYLLYYLYHIVILYEISI